MRRRARAGVELFGDNQGVDAWFFFDPHAVSRTRPLTHQTFILEDSRQQDRGLLFELGVSFMFGAKGRKLKQPDSQAKIRYAAPPLPMLLTSEKTFGNGHSKVLQTLRFQRLFPVLKLAAAWWRSLSPPRLSSPRS
jgi:hypothetical protein